MDYDAAACAICDNEARLQAEQTSGHSQSCVDERIHGAHPPEPNGTNQSICKIIINGFQKFKKIAGTAETTCLDSFEKFSNVGRRVAECYHTFSDMF